MFKINDNNLEFYKNVGVEPLRDLATQGGFITYKDLRIVYPFISHSKCILEIGAGFGRCIDFLLENDFKGKIIGIETSPDFVKYLEKKYQSYSNVELIDGDLKETVLPSGIDAALWMWSGFVDFSKEQQDECVAKISKSLNPNGKLIIDIPKLGFVSNNFKLIENKDNKNLNITTPYGGLRVYIPEENELEEMRKAHGFGRLEVISYKTSTDKERTIYILTK